MVDLLPQMHVSRILAGAHADAANPSGTATVNGLCATYYKVRMSNIKVAETARRWYQGT